MRKTVAQLAGGDLATELVWPLRIESTVLCRSVMGPPWGFGVASRDVGSFHVVVAGEGWLEVDGAEPLPVRAGDVVVLPRGDAHWVRDAPTSAAPPLTSILASHDVVDGELTFGGDREPLTEIVCGTFRVSEPAEPWAGSALPPVVHVAGGAGAAWWPAAQRAIRDEARSPSRGGSAVVNRLLETLLADAMRTAIERWASDPAAAAGLRDRRIGTVLAAIREAPDRPWSVAELARLAAMSRSAFVERFRSLVGAPPMHHVAGVRLRRAAQLLRSGDATVAAVARRSGYGSEEAFSRAFRGRFGESPSDYRRRRRGSLDSGMTMASRGNRAPEDG